MLKRTIGRFLVWPIERIAALVAATGIPPNFITWTALLLNLWAGVFFAAGRFVTAGGIMMLAGCAICWMDPWRGGRAAFRCLVDSWIRSSIVTLI